MIKLLMAALAASLALSTPTVMAQEAPAIDATPGPAPILQSRSPSMVEPAPHIFRGLPTVALISFDNPVEVDGLCAKTAGRPRPESILLACARQQGPGFGNITMPDPCPYADYEYFAALMCHELAHLHGWRHSKGD